MEKSNEICSVTAFVLNGLSIRNFRCLLIMLVIISHCLLNACTREEDASSEMIGLNLLNTYFPTEVGKYWNYKCVHSFGSISSSLTKEEYGVIVRVISESTAGGITVETITPDTTITNVISIDLEGNVCCNNQYMLTADCSEIPIDRFISIFAQPVPIGFSETSWSGTAAVYISETEDQLSIVFKDGERWAHSNGTVGECEHDFKQSYEDGVGLTYSFYLKSVHLKLWNGYYGQYQHAYAYNSWQFTLLNSGIE